jgi:small-conductance mechanosensitive channel
VTNDNITLIVPNSVFVEHTITNWSHGDQKVRFRIPIGVAYGSDLARVKEALLEVASLSSFRLRKISLVSGTEAENFRATSLHLSPGRRMGK